MTIQLLTNGIGVFVERDERYFMEGEVVFSVNGGTPGGKLYHNGNALELDEHGCFATKLRRGKNTFSYRQGHVKHTIESIYFDGSKATIDGFIGTKEQYTSVILDVHRMATRLAELEETVKNLQESIKKTNFLFG